MDFKLCFSFANKKKQYCKEQNFLIVCARKYLNVYHEKRKSVNFPQPFFAQYRLYACKVKYLSLMLVLIYFMTS